MTDRRTGNAFRAQRRDDGRRIGSWLTGVMVVLNLLQLFAVPLLLLPRDPAWGWALLPLALLTTTFWAVIHEAVHGNLHPRRSRNDRYGRMLAVLYGAPFALLKAGHLLHHRYSRTRDRGEVYDPARSSWAKAAPGYYLRLFGGLYLLEVAAVVLAALPAAAVRRLAHAVDEPDTVAGPLLERVARTEVFWQFRIDAAAIAVLHGAAFVAYGSHWWMLLAALAGRGVIVSLSDNAYHYGTDLDEPLEALNLELPARLEVLALSFNLHGMHHRRPGLRWYELRPAFDAEGGRCDSGWFRAVARQIRGPIGIVTDRSADRLS
ncbi:fatty acid desaturase [Nocardia amamiensis]|uniref:Fatty acid desaturase n=1 Tax=Nocardia amamiensis TaxID=404578 RepID=A0ABS0CX91_9NOCA|nr:fatty acid desaturase [Nocardia amamiensis]MBF6300986.1 fatty acid desaturase [Nocardia amamiensis]